jgi:hypothetical protein
MNDYFVAWEESDNPHTYNPGGDRREPVWFRVYRSADTRNESVTPPMTRKEAEEKLRMIQLLDPPAQKELDLWR